MDNEKYLCDIGEPHEHIINNQITNHNKLVKLVSRALKDCINKHGPVDKSQIGSAAKRIAGQFIHEQRNLNKLILKSLTEREKAELNDALEENKSLKKQVVDLVKMCKDNRLI